MKLKNKISKFIKEDCYNFLLKRSKLKGEIKNINRKQKLVEKVTLSIEQEKEIQELFLNNYGKKIDTRWHRLYQSYTGNYDKKYFPEIIFSTELQPLLCDRTVAKQLADKSMVELLYRDIKDLYIPKTIVLNCSGVWYDSDRNIISKEEALDLLKNCGKVVVKKIVNTSSGQGVLLANIKESFDEKNNLTLEEIINKFKDNFIFQSHIENSKEISTIYPKSLNTFRVMTYVVEGKLYHVPIALRIGQGNKEVDNIHAGGMFVHVNDNGELGSKAFTEYQNVYEEHPDTGVRFAGYKIHGIDKMIEIAYKCHGRTPHIKIISWDFTIDKDNRITLVEVNMNAQSIWFPQMASGKSAFGDNTEYMLNLLRDSNTKKVKNS